MTNFGRKVDGRWVDVHQAISKEYLGKLLGLDPQLFFNIDPACKSGDYVVGDSGYRPNEVVEAPVPVPNNANNEWFGCRPLPVGAFWALTLRAYISELGQSDGADRYARLRQSRRTVGVADVINSQQTINPDDARGEFLWFLNFLLTTTHETDNDPLMTSREAKALRLAWLSLN